jgi:hypothetical protein
MLLKFLSSYVLKPKDTGTMDEQLNVSVPKELARKVKTDAVKSGRSAKVVAAAILSEFFMRQNWQERMKIYERHPAKPTGRKLILKAAA